MKAFAILMAALLAAGCASIVSDTDRPVTFESAGAKPLAVTISNEDGEVVHTGTTPFTVTLPTGSGYFDGESYTLAYAGATQLVNASLNPWYLGNIVFGGLIGILIVDPATGAMWKLPERVVVGGEPAATEKRPDATTVLRRR